MANIQWYVISGCISLPGFFPIASAPCAILWPTERSVELLKDRYERALSNRCSQMPRLPCPSRRRAAAGPHDDRIPPFVQLPDPLCDRPVHPPPRIDAIVSLFKHEQLPLGDYYF